MASKLEEVFETTEVTPIEEPEDDDEDVEALMEALYGETQETKNWCQEKAGGIEEDKVEEPAEEEVVQEEEPMDEQSIVANELHPSSVQPSLQPQQGENFLGFLELSAAGKHENFKNDALEEAPTWRDELRRTAEAAAANVEAMTGSNPMKDGSKKVDVNFTSATRFLAYGVMFASVITLCAKASISREETAAEMVQAATAATTARDLKLKNEGLQPVTTDSNKLDPSGEFTAIDEEDNVSPREEAQIKAEERKEKEKQKASDIDKVLEVAKTLAEKEKESSRNGKMDPDAAKILEAAKSLSAKEAAKEAERAAKEKALDDELQNRKQKGIGHHRPPGDFVNDDKSPAREEAKIIKQVEKELQSLDKKDAKNVDDEWPKKKPQKTPEEIAQEEWRAKEKEKLRKEVEEERDRLDEERLRREEEEEREEKARAKAEEAAKQKKIDEWKGKGRQRRSQDATTGSSGATAPDTNSECDAWARAGECKANHLWMHENCATSCKKHSIIDSNPMCGQWAADGECEKNVIYMQHHCAASCGGSNAPAPAPKVEEFSRAKRAAELKKKSKERVKAYVVRGKETSSPRALDEEMPDDEDSLLDKLADIPTM